MARPIDATAGPYNAVSIARVNSLASNEMSDEFTLLTHEIR